MPSSLNADNGVVSGTAGLKSSADSSGVLDLQTNGTTAISISASQVVSFANQPTYTGGTANGVMFLNGSKAVTTGTALTFDGTNLGIGTASPNGRLSVAGNITLEPGGSGPVASSRPQLWRGADGFFGLQSGGDTSGAIGFYTSLSGTPSEQMRLNTTGLGIGTNSPAYKLDVVGPVQSSAGYYINGNTGGGYIWVRDNYALRFGTNDTERMRLDSSGNLGLGTTPSAWGGPFDAMQLGTYGQHIAGQTNTADLKLGTNNYYNGSNYVYTVTGFTAMQMNLGQGVFNVSAAPSGTAGATASLTQIIAVAADQSLALQGATSQSGAGITFPATQSASSNANTLDDYEEGVWTPVWLGSGGDPTITYSEQTGRYTKIGNMVYFSFRLVTTGASGGSGNLRLGGLPFTTTAAFNNPGFVAITFSYGWAGAAVLSMVPPPGSNSFDCYTQYAAFNANTQVGVSAVAGATVYMIAGGCYQAA